MLSQLATFGTMSNLVTDNPEDFSLIQLGCNYSIDMASLEVIEIKDSLRIAELTSSHKVVVSTTAVTIEPEYCCWSSSVEMQRSEETQTLSNIFCRICLEGQSNNGRSGNNEALISPCKCTGTLAQIHKSCLEQWLSISNTNGCEICHFSYKTTRIPPTFKDCLMDPGNTYFCRNLVADIICFVLLTPVLVVSLYLCILGANKYYYEFSSPEQSVGLVGLSFLLLFVYFIWLHITHRYHYTVWMGWKATHEKVKLVLL